MAKKRLMTTENDNILIHLTAYTELKNYLQTKAKDYTVIKTCTEGGIKRLK